MAKLDEDIPMSQVDKFISAEIPKDPRLREIILRNNVHGPCGPSDPNCPCMQDGSCTKRFPKEPADTSYIDDRGYAQFRRRCKETVIIGKGAKRRPVTDRDIVPYSPFLSLKYDAHVNADLCSTNHCVQYLFKYINKGGDRAKNVVVEAGVKVDETKDYVDNRYMSVTDCAWRIFEFNLHERFPAVHAISIHLEDEDMVIYDKTDPTKALFETTELTRYLDRPKEKEFDHLTICAYYETYREMRRKKNKDGSYEEPHPRAIPHPDGKHYILRRTGPPIISRIHWVPPL